MTRRSFLLTSLFASLGVALRAAVRKQSPKIVLRSSWKTANIGDIAHTPGLLALLEKFLPEAEVILWPSNVGDGVEAMLRRRFPRLVITRDHAVIETGDFLLHGSGPYLVAHRDIDYWRSHVRKPYGVYGITMAPAGDPGMKIMKNNGLDEHTRELLDGASFVFLRDSVSLEVVRAAGIAAPVVDFGPDAAFASDVRNDDAADAFLREHRLQEGKYLCCIPNLRNAPYWQINPRYTFDPAKHRRNEEMKEHDHAPLRDAIVEVVRRTDLKVLVCPEDSTQMATGKELLVDPLPDDIKPRVVWRPTYWLTDEATSTYLRSAGLFGNEMHSPILCVGHGIPAIVCRFAEQTTKGYMWRDIGLGDWLFDLDNASDRARIAATVLAMARDPSAARAKARQARAFVQARQAMTMAALRSCLTLDAGPARK
ncbi:polysaccharide pyruvyl transferase [Termitidicoccus mucosus]|uniref:Polysaccharide pyruvyl transferase n=1 Tax=Termitidicoccus mucosus TaxID=1184151 RepID=A0A178IER4_9BACT|nr:polysaccharide pyruvyl transferase [Opitutaceae bacterium TSB47]